MRLRNLILISVIAPLFLVLLIFSLVAIKSLEENVSSRLEREAQVITNVIGTTLSHAITRGAIEPIEESLYSAFSFHRIYGAYVFDARGREIYGLGLGQALFSPDTIHEVAEQGEMRAAYRKLDDWHYYSVLKPLLSPTGEVQAVLQVNRLNTGIEKYTGFLSQLALLAFVIGAVGIVLGIWWGFRQHIERPLERLLIVMQRIEAGDRDQRAEVGGPQEYARLAVGLNGMLDAMAEMDADIEVRRRKEIELENACANRRSWPSLAYLLRAWPTRSARHSQ